MATEAQINANRENAKHSTGARTHAGRAASSLNNLTYGLYTRRDFVRPEEQDEYDIYVQNFYNELKPIGLLEDTLACEIVSASWRLKRCSRAESGLDFEDYSEATDKTRRSIERARSAAQLALNRALTQLKKLQKDRPDLPNEEAELRDMERDLEKDLNQVLSSLMSDPGPSWKEIFPAPYPKTDSSGLIPTETHP
jgi:hypothetical protein